MFGLVEAGARRYGESWANATRISKDKARGARCEARPLWLTRRAEPRSEAGRLSLWTPLHQAVYMGAPADVVERLISLGASRMSSPISPPISSHRLSTVETGC